MVIAIQQAHQLHVAGRSVAYRQALPCFCKQPFDFYVKDLLQAATAAHLVPDARHRLDRATLCLRLADHFLHALPLVGVQVIVLAVRQRACTKRSGEDRR